MPRLSARTARAASLAAAGFLVSASAVATMSLPNKVLALPQAQRSCGFDMIRNTAAQGWRYTGSGVRVDNGDLARNVRNVIVPLSAQPHWMTNCQRLVGTNTRAQRVMQAVSDIRRKLIRGCIRNNSLLYRHVPAFRHRHLDRREFNAALQYYFLGGLSSFTFDCQEYRNDGVWGSWDSRTPRTITLYWTTDKGPSNFAVLEEFVHAAGFNERLQQWYSRDSIERQTHMVARSCFP